MRRHERRSGVEFTLFAAVVAFGLGRKRKRALVTRIVGAKIGLAWWASPLAVLVVNLAFTGNSMSDHAGLLTVEEYLKLPDPKEGRTELHHGEVVIIPPPKWGHQTIQGRIVSLLTELARDHAVVWVGMAFRPTPEYELWQADVGMVSLERESATGDDEYLLGAPELVVEVLTPSSKVVEINDKMNICIDNGCRSFWVVDPRLKRVSVTEGDVIKHYGGSASVPCSLLGGDFQVQEVFQ